MVSLVNESVIFTITILTAYIQFASLKLKKSNHIVKILAKIHSFTSTINPIVNNLSPGLYFNY